MDFNTIWQLVEPYVGTSTFAFVIVAVFVTIFKVSKWLKQMGISFKNTNAAALERFKNAIPSEVKVSLETLTKSEISKLRAQFVEIIDEKVLQPIKDNAELCKVIAETLAVSKLTPDDYKERLKELLSLPEVETTNSLKVELLPEEPKATAQPIESKEEKALID